MRWAALCTTQHGFSHSPCSGHCIFKLMSAARRSNNTVTVLSTLNTIICTRNALLASSTENDEILFFALAVYQYHHADGL